ncbi:MAG: GNAT family N-acetyltransferase [Nitriliruptorales bacterium]|nr:GNAT family N-acetyltransferase [Nitriliruptorales bacterium]
MTSVRNARRGDLASVVAVMNAVDVAALGEPDTTEEDIATGWDESVFDVCSDAFVAEDDDEVIGYGELYPREEQTFDADVYVHPDAADEVAKALLDAVMARAATRGGAGVRLATWVPVGDRSGRAFAAAGFKSVRTFVRMRYSGDGIPAAPDPPAGIVLRPFDQGRDAPLVHEVLVEAFAGHVRPMTPSLERFTEQHLDHPDFRPGLWVLAEHDSHVVGAITVFDHGDIGFIRHVGVRSGHRGRGIGAAVHPSRLPHPAAARTGGTTAVTLEPRPVSASEVTFARTMTQADANLVGNIHGGVIMKEVDVAGGTAAARHAGGVCVTAAIDELSFLQPVHIGDVLVVSARVNAVGKTSLEVGVRVEAEPWQGGERRHTTSAYLLFVCLGQDGRPREVPPLIVETDDERRREQQAQIRRQARKERIQRLGSYGPGPAPQPDS